MPEWVWVIAIFVAIVFCFMFLCSANEQLVDEHTNVVIKLYDTGRPLKQFMNVLTQQHGVDHAQAVILRVMTRRPDIQIIVRRMCL